MSILQYFKNELDNQNTNYFMFDTKGGGKHGDIDFEKYEWSPSRYNLVKTGDLFIYRRPSKNSETKQFYFFGACKIGLIQGEQRYSAAFSKKYPFQNYLHQNELSNFKWVFKQRGDTWEHFFNQYGMNKITKNDFINLIRLSDDENQIDEEALQVEVEAIQAIQSQSYFVDDKQSTTTVRYKQKVFADQVKLNYQYRCAMCGIRTKEFLISSHIIPWSKRKDTRLDPSNGICLCSFHDKAFDAGYLTVNDNYLIEISNTSSSDIILAGQLKPLHNKKLKIPMTCPPNKEYLKYHRETIFKI